MKDWNGNKRTTYAQLGASNHADHDREIRDFYATSPEAIDKLKAVYDIPKNIVEISAGNGHLSERLKELGHNVISWDIIQRDYPLDQVQDFLAVKELPKGYSILTNPPFSEGLSFVLHSLELLPEGGASNFLFKNTIFGKSKKI